MIRRPKGDGLVDVALCSQSELESLSKAYLRRIEDLKLGEWLPAADVNKARKIRKDMEQDLGVLQSYMHV